MGLPWEPTKGPKSKRLAAARYRALMAQMNDDELRFEDLKDVVPEEWHTLELDLDCIAPKDKVTLYLDRAVARTFKAMGQGYQARINRVLELWLQLQIAKPWHEEREIVEWAAEALEAQDRADYQPDRIAEHQIRLMESLAWQKGYEAGRQAGEGG